MGCRPASLASNVVDASQVVPATRSRVLVDEEPPSFILDSRARDEENTVPPSVPGVSTSSVSLCSEQSQERLGRTKTP